MIRVEGPPRVRLVKGSHIVVPQLFDHDTRLYLPESPIAASCSPFPIERDFTLIGTTDENFTRRSGGRRAVAERDRLSVRDRVATISAKRHARATWSGPIAGVRSLYDDGSKQPEDVTRDYHLELDKRFGEAPLLTVYGGKITTYRRLAEDALQMLRQLFFDADPAWTARAPLPGGDFPYDGVDALVGAGAPHLAVPRQTRMRCGWCAPMARASMRILGDAHELCRSRRALRRRPDRRPKCAI